MLGSDLHGHGALLVLIHYWSESHHYSSTPASHSICGPAGGWAKHTRECVCVLYLHPSCSGAQGCSLRFDAAPEL